MSLTVGSLFSGVGGLELGLERAGMTTKWQVEIDEYARRVLEKHWPSVKRYNDVRDVHGQEACRHVTGIRCHSAFCLAPVDLICGGFPCTDISIAGKGLGLDGPDSGLWREYLRLIRQLRPRYVLVENTPALLVRGIDRVLSDLAASGYDAEWDCIPAAAVGAPHRRDRLFIVAYADDTRRGEQWRAVPIFAQQPAPQRSGWWATEPGIRRVVDGLPPVVDRVSRLRCLGNAVLPQVAEWIGRRILAKEAA